MDRTDGIRAPMGQHDDAATQAGGRRRAARDAAGLHPGAAHPDLPSMADAAALLGALQRVRQQVRRGPQRAGAWLQEVPPERRDAARNLAHYLALRRIDLRTLQPALTTLGLSSLGRAEGDVLGALDAVIDALGHLAATPGGSARLAALAGPQGKAHPTPDASAALQACTTRLFGPAPARRSTRIMVTMPSESATDPQIAAALVEHGMDVARINAAHDDAPAWEAIAGHVRSAARAAGRSVRILFDLGGPKLRTGSMGADTPVLKLKPMRDRTGHVVQPGRLQLRPLGGAPDLQAGAESILVEPGWLRRLKVGDRIELTDTRGRERTMRVVERGLQGDEPRVLLECRRTAYLGGETELRHGPKSRATAIAGLPLVPARLRLNSGDLVRIVAEDRANAAADDDGARRDLATITCTLPQVFAQVQPGQAIAFDDGRITGAIEVARSQGLLVRITQCPQGGAWLAAGKGINLPESTLDLPALTAQDLRDLDTGARIADIIGLSFAQGEEDVRALLQALRDRDAADTAVMLKIETRRGFTQLPAMLYAALGAPAAGVMIARGDLAVEVGWERMAEVQEEILWACEAARIPVVWATQVLESLAKDGRPSRAEVTDAAAGGRAECVMLNKGPYILDAVVALDDILQRMQGHRDKRRPMLRALHAWPSSSVAD